jgi:hypothetical protein
MVELRFTLGSQGDRPGVPTQEERVCCYLDHASFLILMCLLWAVCHCACPQVRQNQRDTMWHTWTVTLGFPVMGIWQPGDDGTDINSACR